MTLRLPDFIIIGAQKAGTTWLGARLSEQPSVFLSRPLEVHFFDRDDHYAKGLEWYARHFEAAPRDAVVGEKTPDYFWTVRPAGRGPNDIPSRIHKMLPDARLIIVLRDPVTRAISALNHVVRARWLSPFVDPNKLLSEALNADRDPFGLIDRGHYLVHLKRFLEFYPRDKIHVVLFEDDIVGTPQAALDHVMRFIGCPNAQPIVPRARPENKRMNSRLGLLMNYYAPALSPVISGFDRLLPVAPEIAPGPECRAQLYRHFQSHNEALFEFLGRATEAWRIDYRSRRKKE